MGWLELWQPSWTMRKKPCTKAGRATRQKKPGFLMPWSTITALEWPFSSLLLHNKETSILLKLRLFWVSCHLQPKTNTNWKIPEKKKTKTEKQREMRGSMMSLNRDLIHGTFSLGLVHRRYPRTLHCHHHPSKSPRPLPWPVQWPPNSSS